jgi:hypothetical protein
MLSGQEWGAGVFVWGAWAALFLTLLYLVVRYGSPVPFCDDWYYLSGLITRHPPSFEHLWAQNHEHRIPLPLFVDWLSLRLSGCDFRGPAFVCALALGGLALGLTRVAGRLRGQTRYADAFLPVTLFGTAWADSNFYFTKGGLLQFAVDHRGRRTPGRRGEGDAVIPPRSAPRRRLLPLCGAPGLLYVPAFFTWLWVSTLLGLRAQAGRQRYMRLGVLAGISAGLLLIGSYYSWWPESGSSPRTPAPSVASPGGKAAPTSRRHRSWPANNSELG